MVKIVKNLCFVINKNYFDKMLVTFNSIVLSDKDIYNVYILNNDLASADFTTLKTLYPEHSFIDTKVDNELFKSSTKMRDDTNMTAYFKLYIPQVIPCDKVLFLDCDIVVVRPLTQLYNLDLGDKPFAAVKDPLINELALDYKKSIGLTESDPYFNSGVMLFNLKVLRNNYLFQDMLSILQSGKYLRFHDQELLNIVYKNNYEVLPEKYNYLTIFRGIKDLFIYPFRPQVNKEIVILHYSNLKPWNNNYFGKYKKIYKKVYQAVNKKYTLSFYHHNNPLLVVKALFQKIGKYFYRRKAKI